MAGADFRVNGVTQLLRSLGMGRLLILGAVGVGLLIFFVFMAERITAPGMALLYGGLEPADAGEIVNRLEGMGVPYKLQGDGTQIMVPSDRVLRVRMSLAGEGLPVGASVGYEIFDRSDGFGTTNLVQNINMVRALEGELGRTISALGPVSAARVHLVLPKRELFNRDQARASASIAVKLRGAGTLTRQQVAAIQNLVAAAVPGLSPERIAIVDDAGNLLARGTDGEGAASGPAAGAEDFRATYEGQLRHKIETLLEQSVGLGKVRAEVSADIDFDRFTTNDEIYNPDGQVVRSQQLVEESARSEDTEGNLPVTATNNLPVADPEVTGASASNASQRVEETINYEISRTVRTHVREGGTVKRLSVAVMVDGRYTTDDDGTRTYQPRAVEELRQLTQLVRTAVGYDEERGDTVEVVNLQFAEIETPEGLEEGGLAALENVDIMKVLEIVVLGFVAVLVVMLVLRPLVNRLINPPDVPAADLPDPAAVAAQIPPPTEGGEGGASSRTASIEGASSPSPSTTSPLVDFDDEEDILVDMAKVDGRVKQSHVRRIGEIVDKHPEEALNIVRNWLYTQ